MCGAPVSSVHGETIVIDENNAAAKDSETSRELWLTAWLALPLSLAVVYGVYRWEPIFAAFVGPAIVLATLVTLLHGTLVTFAARPKNTGQRAAVAGSSALVGILTFVGTFAITALIFIVVVAFIIISLCAGLMEACGIKIQ
jgi:hypothetical protein